MNMSYEDLFYQVAKLNPDWGFEKIEQFIEDELLVEDEVIENLTTLAPREYNN